MAPASASPLWADGQRLWEQQSAAPRDAPGHSSRVAERILDRLLQRHGPPRRPRRRERFFPQRRPRRAESVLPFLSAIGRERSADGLAQLAERTDLSIGNLSQIERGVRSPSVRSLQRLSECLKVPVADLFQTRALPPAAELGWFLGFDAWRFDGLAKDEVIDEFRDLYGERCDETALQLSLIGTLVQLGGLLGFWVTQERSAGGPGIWVDELAWWAQTVERALTVWLP